MRRATHSSLSGPSDSPEAFQKSLTDEMPHFFEYSAIYWTSHLCASGRSLPQDLLQSAVRISRWNTNSLFNWSDQYRLSSTDLVPLPKDLDPLIVSAFFSLIGLANDILHNHGSELRENSKPLALTWACRMGYLEVVEALLDQGTPVTSGWVEGGSPISWACIVGNLEIARVLLKKTDSSQLNQRDGNGRTPLSLAVGSGHIDITKLLLAREDIDVNMDDRSGATPLLWAVGSNPGENDLMLLTCLVSDPRVDVSRRDRHGRTVLSWAAEKGSLDAINILINSQRPDVELLLHDAGDTIERRSPLSYAAFYGHVDVVEALCKTGKIDIQLASVDKQGQNVFVLAADKNFPEVIKILVDFYPEGVDFPEEGGRTPLSCAMWGSPGNAETVRTLLRTGLVNVNRRAENGRTPLFFAAASGRADLIRILVEEGGADLDIPDNEGKLPDDKYIDWRYHQVKEEIDRLREVRLA
jgi:ankyrin repeat domain-containing protein 50